MKLSHVVTIFLIHLCTSSSSVIQDEGVSLPLQQNMSVNVLFPNLKHLESLADVEHLRKGLDQPIVSTDFRSEALDHGLPKPCLNNSTFAFNNEVRKTCRWIRTNEARRQRLCKNSYVRLNCPQSCGLCCEDDPEYFFITKNSTRRTCDWIGEKELQQRFCDRRKNGRMVRDACPLTCNFCLPKVALPNITVSNEPSNSSVEAINTLSSAPSQVICQDNPLYNAPFQGDCGCNLVVGTNCSLWSVFLSDFQVAELFENCPVSCGTCR